MNEMHALGYAAYFKGVELIDCPFNLGERDWFDWRYGWFEAFFIDQMRKIKNKYK